MATIEVQSTTVWDGPTAVGTAGPSTVVIDRPAEAGGGHGLNGGQLLNLAVAGCISNDLYRDAAAANIRLYRVRVRVRSDYGGDPPVSGPIDYEVEIQGDASDDELEALVKRTDQVAEIPNSLRQGTPVRLAGVRPQAVSRRPR